VVVVLLNPTHHVHNFAHYNNYHPWVCMCTPCHHFEVAPVGRGLLYSQ
jgi:hypothetical protein